MPRVTVTAREVRYAGRSWKTGETFEARGKDARMLTELRNAPCVLAPEPVALPALALAPLPLPRNSPLTPSVVEQRPAPADTPPVPLNRATLIAPAAAAQRVVHRTMVAEPPDRQPVDQAPEPSPAPEEDEDDKKLAPKAGYSRRDLRAENE